jgi:hypothetical protein
MLNCNYLYIRYMTTFQLFKYKVQFVSFLIADSYDRLFPDSDNAEVVTVIGGGVSANAFQKYINKSHYCVHPIYASSSNIPKQFNNPKLWNISPETGSGIVTAIDYATGNIKYKKINSDSSCEHCHGEQEYVRRKNQKTVVCVGSELVEQSKHGYGNKIMNALNNPPFYPPCEPNEITKVAIIGSDAMGIGLAFKLRDIYPSITPIFFNTHVKITLHDMREPEQMFYMMSDSAKKIVINELVRKRISSSWGKVFMKTDEDYVISATKNKKNLLTERVHQNLDFSTWDNPNFYLIGDCCNLGYPKTAQDAYAQGKYLAQKFNHDKSVSRHFFPTLKYILSWNSIIGDDENTYQYYKNNVVHVSDFEPYKFEHTANTIYIGDDRYCVDFVKWNCAFAVNGYFVRLFHEIFYD